MENKINILLVEDNPDHQELMKKALMEFEKDYQIDAVSSGKEALRKTREKDYSLILLDYNLPDINGMEVLREINESGKDVPIVMITGAGNEQIAVEAMKLGAYDYITKTRGYLSTFPMVIKKSIERHRLKAEKERAIASLTEAKLYTDNIIKSMIDTLIVVDPSGKIRSINKVASDLLGYKENELIGKPIDAIFAEEEEEEAMPFKGTRMKRLIEEGSIKDYEMTYKTKSGEKIPVSLSGSVMYEPRVNADKDAIHTTRDARRIIGIVIIAHDMRQIRRLMQKEKELASAAAAAADTERKRSEELASINKELRTTNDEVQKAKQELEKRTETVEKLNTFMVGRELKMIELKKRIKELEEKP
ncbi:MAG: response regulator [Candidatus Omnitrophica bacterium]|nr:response regulator [Candidatus Omnitrophota bacterium]